jgi:hypothetical protein
VLVYRLLVSRRRSRHQRYTVLTVQTYKADTVCCVHPCAGDNIFAHLGLGTDYPQGTGRDCEIDKGELSRSSKSGQGQRSPKTQQ